MSHYLVLFKARLSALVLVSTAAGFVLASASGSFDSLRMVWTLLGTFLAAAGANTLNQVIEVERDRRMDRTRNRPLPAGHISRTEALVAGIILALAGPALLLVLVNGLTAALGLATVVIYVLIYTPLKPITTLNTPVGAVCGAIPPLMGWAAVSGNLAFGAWVLALLLFIWQIPHFLALAWLHRADYARGGFRMLPIVDPEGAFTCRVMIRYTFALLPLGPLAALQGVTSWAFAAEALALGVIFLGFCYHLQGQRSRANARAVFLASVIYLPVVLGLMMADRGTPFEIDTTLATRQPISGSR